MAYRLEIERRAAKQIEALPPRLQARMIAALEELAEDPYAAPNVVALAVAATGDAWAITGSSSTWTTRL